MANKMISVEDLHDDFLSAVIRSEEPVQVPEGFMDEVMNRISLITAVKKVKPYTPPIWLKWGIPGFILSCFIVLLLWGPKEPIKSGSGLSLFEKMLYEINSWFTGFNINIHFPALNLSGTLVWVLVGGIVLIWSFWLLSRFLEKKYRTDQ
ncbi:MAG: hypothetical protein D4R64_06740 [Porphyromonadaceae bacterium]|nr:MAG: hypothetical protein D4R64_06740 [Porphyromonadaceae bacterium]